MARCLIYARIPSRTTNGGAVDLFDPDTLMNVMIGTWGKNTPQGLALCLVATATAGAPLVTSQLYAIFGDPTVGTEVTQLIGTIWAGINPPLNVWGVITLAPNARGPCDRLRIRLAVPAGPTSITWEGYLIGIDFQ